MDSIQVKDRKTGKMITETPPNEWLLKFLFTNPFGALPLHLLFIRKFFSKWVGKQMDKPKSTQRIAKFVSDSKINMDEAEKSVSEFATFNDFFYRKLKPTVRPIADGMVSPADGKIIAFESIAKTKEFFVKGNHFTLPKFLKDDALAEKFKNCALLLIRLAPNDYHRFHFPYAGKISESKLIEGPYYSVSPYAVKENFTIFCENKREYSILETADKGDIVICEIGATMVGAIFQTYVSDAQIEKGDEKGYFAFGGSSVILLIDSDKITIDADILENTKNNIETTVLMGERIGV